jgi:hypothetical protein
MPEGMLCSKQLGLSDDHPIYLLAPEAPVGVSLVVWLGGEALRLTA